MKTILILGSSGFIGSNLLEKLLEDEYRVILLTRDIHHIKHNFYSNKRVTIIEGELSDFALLRNIICNNKVELVIHLVSQLIPSSTKEDFNEEINNIVFPTYTLLEYLSEKNIKIVFFSSGGTIYGKVENDKAKEDHVAQPINYYGYSKLMIENYIYFLNRTKNLSYLILRASNVYGKGQRLEAQQGFIAVAIGKILSGNPIEIWGNGEIVRDYIDVEDIVVLTKELISMNINNEIMNLGSGKGINLNQIVKILQKNIDKKIQIEYKNARSVDIEKIVLDNNKLLSFIDYDFKNIETGIANFLEYAMKNNEK